MHRISKIPPNINVSSSTIPRSEPIQLDKETTESNIAGIARPNSTVCWFLIVWYIANIMLETLLVLWR